MSVEDRGARRGSVGAEDRLTAPGVCGMPYGGWLDGRTAALSGVDNVACGAGDGRVTDDTLVQPDVHPEPGAVTTDIPQLDDDAVTTLELRQQYDTTGDAAASDDR